MSTQTTTTSTFDAAFDAGEITWVGDVPTFAPAAPKFTPQAEFDAAFDAGQIAWIDDEVWAIA